MKICFSLFLLFLSLSIDAGAQSDDPVWRNALRSKEWGSYCLANVNDADGNSYSFSSIKDTVPSYKFQDERQIEVRYQTIVLQRISNTGKTVWTHEFRDETFCAGSVDDFGNLFYLGYRQDSTLNFQFFIRKFFPSGNLISEQKLFQPIPEFLMRECRVNQILVDHEGDVVLAGTFTDTLSSNSIFIDKSRISEEFFNRMDVFITKLDKTGNTLWYRKISGGRYMHVYGTDLDANGNVYITGDFASKIRVDGKTYTSQGNSDSFVYKISPKGQPLLFQVLSGSYSDDVFGVAVDEKQNIYLTGHYGVDTEFDTKNKTQKYDAIGNTDAFLLKLDSVGNFNWVRTIGDKYQRSKSFSVQTIGDLVFWIGEFEGQIDFDPRNTVLKLTSDGSHSSRKPTRFIQTYRNNGDFVDAIPVKKDQSSRMKTITVIDETTFQVVGKHFNDFNESDKHYLLTLNQYKFAKENESIISITACDSFFWDVTKLSYSKSGVYFGKNPQTKLPVELNLEIYKMNTELIYDGESIYAEEENAIYQWLDCTDGCVQMTKAVGGSITPRKTGDYRLQLTSTMCDKIDTSDVVHIEVLRIDIRTLDIYYEPNHDITIDDVENVHLPLDGEKVKMVPFRVDYLYGFVKNGDPDTWIVQPKFEQVFAVYETGAIVKDSTTKGYGFIDNTGEYLIPPYFQQITKEQNVLHAISIFVRDRSLNLPPSHNTFNYHVFFDLNGKELFQEYTHDQGNFSGEDLAWFRFGKKVRIRDLKGTIVDSFEVDFTKQFLGIANSKLIFKIPGENWTNTIKAFSLDGQLEFKMELNTDGKVYKINENLFGVSDSYDHSYYFVDKHGKGARYSFDESAVADKLQTETYFKEKYFIVLDRDLNRYGVIDRSGKKIIPCKYHRIEQRVNGYWACYGQHEKAEYVDSSGNVAWIDKDPISNGYGREVRRYTLAQSKGFYDGLSFACRHHYITDADGYSVDSSYFYYYDIRGNEKFSLDTSFMLTGNFSEGLAPIVTNERGLGFINKTGEIVIQPRYELVVVYLNMFSIVPRFSGGYAYVKSHNGYIDRNGKEYFSGERMQDRYNFSH